MQEKPLPELAYDEFGNAAVGRKAAVVSANEYTSKIGFDILKKGGNDGVGQAVVGEDLGGLLVEDQLVEHSGSPLLKADMDVTIYLKETGEYICIEAMETAPAAAGIDTLDEINEKQGAMLVTVPGQAAFRPAAARRPRWPWRCRPYRRRRCRPPRSSAGCRLLVTVPGQVHGALSALEKYGTMSREEVLEPVIKLAEASSLRTSLSNIAEARSSKLIWTSKPSSASLITGCAPLQRRRSHAGDVQHLGEL
mgnify:CR=1 FL=1